MLGLSWSNSDIILHWVAAAGYLVASALYVYSVFFKNANTLTRAGIAAVAGLVPHSAALLIRWIQQDHGPYMTRYEVLSSDAWVAVVFFLLLGKKWRGLRSAGMIVLPTAFLMLGVAQFANPQIQHLPPSLRSVWLVLHVTCAKLAAGGFVASLGAAVLFLLQQRSDHAEFMRRFPTTEVLDEYSYKFAGFGWIFWTVNIAAGSIWAHESWGRYWGWDPIETWSLITWLIYGMFAHLRLFWKWRGKKSALFLIGCFAMSVFTIFILPFVAKSLHSEYFVP